MTAKNTSKRMVSELRRTPKNSDQGRNFECQLVEELRKRTT